MTRSTERPRAPSDTPAAERVVPLLRGWLNLICFEISLCVGTLLVVSVPATHRAVAAVYAGSVAALFGVSALYHRGRWRPGVALLLERLDHAMIFVLIGGTATPLFLICLPARVGLPLVVVLLSLDLIALGVHLVWIDAPEKLVTATYIALGCLAGVVLPAVWVHAGVAAAVLVLSGGLVYIIGAVLFAGYRPDPRPDVFGYHEVWHCFVCAAAAMHYVAIALLVL